MRRLIERPNRGIVIDNENDGCTLVHETLFPLVGRVNWKERTGGTRYGPQTATMGLDNGAADRQSHSDTLRLGGEEWFKDTACYAPDRVLFQNPELGSAQHPRSLRI